MQMVKTCILGRNILHFTYIKQSINPHKFYEVFLNGPKVTKKSSISAQNTSDSQTF